MCKPKELPGEFRWEIRICGSGNKDFWECYLVGKDSVVADCAISEGSNSEEPLACSVVVLVFNMEPAFVDSNSHILCDGCSGGKLEIKADTDGNNKNRTVVCKQQGDDPPGNFTCKYDSYI